MRYVNVIDLKLEERNGSYVHEGYLTLSVYEAISFISIVNGI